MILKSLLTEGPERTTWVGSTVLAESIGHSSTENTLLNPQSDESMLGRRETMDMEPSENVSQNSVKIMSTINAASIPFFQREGFIVGVSIAVGVVIITFMIIILILMRRIQRTKRQVGEPGARTPVSLERNTGGVAPRTVSEPRQFDGSTPIRIRSLEEGMDDLAENFFSSTSNAGDHSPPTMSTTRLANQLDGHEDHENSPRPSPAMATAHFERSSSSNLHAPQRTLPQRPSIIIPEHMGGISSIPGPITIESQLSSPERNGREHCTVLSEFSSTPVEPIQSLREYKSSTTSCVQYPDTPASGYPASTYPPSTLPGYPDTLRSVTPPPYYYDLSRTHTLRSVRSFGSAYDPDHWSRGDIPSLPMPYAQ